MKLARLVERHAQTRPDSPALSDGREVLSWSAVHQLALYIEQRFGRTAQGARVAVCGDPGVFALPLVIGLMSAGASVAMLASSELGRTETALDQWTTDAWVEVDARVGSDSLSPALDVLAGQLQTGSHGRRSACDVPSVVFSTSGSTGKPRLVTCPDEQLTAVSRTIASVLGLRPTDVILSASPPHFDYGFNQFVLAAASGASVVQADHLSLGHLISHGLLTPTVLASGPSQLRLVAAMPESKVRSSSLRMVTSTGSPFPIEVTDQLLGLWPSAQIRSMYGMTECKRVSISTHDQFLASPQSVGSSIPGVSVSSDPVTGELLVRTPYLMSFDSKASTSGPRVITDEGGPLLATGDVGRVSEDGQVQVLGRLSQFAKIHDVRVSFAECEQVAVRHPDVREAAVTCNDGTVAVWCEVDGMIDENHTRDRIRTEIVAWTGVSGLSDVTVQFMRSMPRLPNGKIDRHGLEKLQTETVGEGGPARS